MADVRFVYEGDEPGRIRTLTDWRENKWYLVGIDDGDGREKTFRKDRVVYYVSGHTRLKDPYGLEGDLPAQRSESAPIDDRPQIVFTGFRKVDRDGLEALAQSHNMWVRKTATRGCDYMVVGPTAGPRKMELATAQGVLILTEAEFLALVQTGELPEFDPSPYLPKQPPPMHAEIVEVSAAPPPVPKPAQPPPIPPLPPVLVPGSQQQPAPMAQQPVLATQQPVAITPAPAVLKGCLILVLAFIAMILVLAILLGP